jgi:hypothetical protein
MERNEIFDTPATCTFPGDALQVFIYLLTGIRLTFHKITTRIPREVHVMLPRGAEEPHRRSKILSVYRVFNFQK